MRSSTAILKTSDMPVVIAGEIAKLNEKISKIQKEISALEDSNRPKLSLFYKIVSRWKIEDVDFMGWTRKEGAYKDFYLNSSDIKSLIANRKEMIREYKKEILNQSQKLQEITEADIEN